MCETQACTWLPGCAAAWADTSQASVLLRSQVLNKHQARFFWNVPRTLDNIIMRHWEVLAAAQALSTCGS